ncbi:Peptidoglycan hydrolase flgJ [Klebsiella pneumoniae]|nr:Peptidoglycan hydrolase flgJ [Klebsiella pneumoniae]
MSEIDQFNTASWDVRSLDTLKLKAGGSESPQALRAAAKQMEGIFVQVMLKSMRDAGFKDGLMHSQASEMYTSMHDQQLAQDLAQKSQLGFADMIVRQMGGEGEDPPGQAQRIAAPAPGPYSLTHAPVSAPSATTGAQATPLSAIAARSSSSQPFISRLLRPALQAAQSSGIHPHLILAQAALESGWGKREILTAEGKPSHNLFGIKATGDWQGKTTEITTTEYINGTPQKIKAAFRVYDSYAESLSDYARLLKNNPRYQRVAQSSSAEQGAHALQAGGYATDPAYANKLINIIQQVKGNITQGVQAYKNDLSQLF